MTNNTFRNKLVAVVTAGAMLIISVRVVSATPGVHRGALLVMGAVEVNGEQVISGGTVFSDSAIVTREQSGATINLGGMGRVALLANSTLRLSFTDSGLKGRLDAGQAHVSTPAGVSVSLATPGGVVLVAGNQSTSFGVTTQNGETKVAATMGAVELISDAGCTLITGREDAVGDGLPNQPTSGQSKKGLAAALAALGGVVATVLWIVTHDSQPHEEDMTFGGTVTIPSGGPR